MAGLIGSPVRVAGAGRPPKTIEEFAPTPLQGLHRYCGQVPPLCPAAVRRPSSGLAAWGAAVYQRPRAATGPPAAAGRGTTGAQVAHRSPDHARARSMPETTWPTSRRPPGSRPGWAGRPVSMPSRTAFDTSSVDRSRSPSWPTPEALTARLAPRTLTATALDRSNSGWFAASPCRATADDHRPHGPASQSGRVAARRRRRGRRRRDILRGVVTAAVLGRAWPGGARGRQPGR
jgi:hypothetical protein